MNVQKQIEAYISDQPESKQPELRSLHQQILQALPGCKLWFDDGKNSENKTVTNPTIGYGSQTIRYANGKSREYFQIGISANKTGISVYILGLQDKKYLANTFAKKLGKAEVTGYCIRFKALKDIDPAVLQEAIQYGVNATTGE